MTLADVPPTLSPMSRSRPRRHRAAGWILLLALANLPARAEPVIIFAAASLGGALSELWPPHRHPDVSLSFAGSSMLARA